MSAAPHLTPANAFDLGPIAFRPSDGALTHATGVNLGIRGPNGTWQRITLPAPVVDLSYTADDGLYVLHDHGLVALDRVTQRCEKREVYGEALIPTDTGVVQLLSQTYMEGTGVFNELSPIQRDCTLGEALFEQSAPVASVSVGGHRWIARTVVYTGGPSRAADATLTRDDATPMPILPEVSGLPRTLLATEDRALVMSDSGVWELWQAPDAKRLAHGESTAETAAWLPGKRQIAVGRDLVTVATGAVQKDVLPGAVVGVDPQGKVWVLRDGGQLRVYTAQ